MASIQETLRGALGADAALTALVADRIYPGQVPDDEDPAPWLYYAVPSSVPYDQLDAGPVDVRSEVEFHALGDCYEQAKGIIDRVIAVLNSMTGAVVKQAQWLETTEEVTEDGYHHACRFMVLWVMS